MRGEPHCAAEDFGGVGCGAGDVEEAVLDAPAAAEGEGDAVSGQVDLGFGLLVSWAGFGEWWGGCTFERSG